MKPSARTAVGWACAALAASGCLACADERAGEALPADAAAGPSAVDSMPPAPAPFVPRDSVVFAFEVSENEYVSFEPLVHIVADTMSGELPEQGTQEADLLERLWYSPGTRYHALSGGAPVGVIEVDGAALAGCTGLPGDATFVNKVPAAPLRGLAVAREPSAAAYVVEATAREDSLARAAVLDRLRGAGVPDSALAEVVWHPVQVVAASDGSRTVVASAEVRAFEDAERPAGAFIMLESTLPVPRVIDSTAGDGRSMDAGRPELFDAEDLDGDGSPEIVVRNYYYESWDYTILRRVAGRWETIFQGGGSGC